MKIAFVGKGGSGKSTMSWLASEVSVADGLHTLTIDADHNMDICHIYGVTVGENFPTLHRNHDQFRKTVGQEADRAWSQIVLDERPLPAFTLHQPDPFTEHVTAPLKERHLLMVTGLGSEDILHSGRCAHGHSAPLKFYLPLLELTKTERCIIDGVAGVDMLNFGLFAGADILVGVVEPHPNSIRVLSEIVRLGQETDVPTLVLINKARENEYLSTIRTEYNDQIIGEIPLDENLLDYNFSSLAPSTISAMQSALTALPAYCSSTTGLERIRTFEGRRKKTN